MTGKELCSLMRKHRVTIRELSLRTGITLKRIRQCREDGLADPNVIRDWMHAITGVDLPSRLPVSAEQLADMRDRHPGTILLFRVERVYQCYGEDAVLVARLLNRSVVRHNLDVVSVSSSRPPLSGVNYRCSDGTAAQIARSVVYTRMDEGSPCKPRNPSYLPP